MSGIWIQIVQFLLAFSILVILHEWGHYIFARIFKTKVEKFYLFFDFLFPFSNILNFSLWKKKKGDTEFGVGWFPLGGYVKIAGMVDESMDTEALQKDPEPWEFRAKKPWQRLLIMLGGIIMNVLLAIFIYSMILFKWGEEKLPMSQLQNGVLIADSLGYNLGFKDGDQILEINGEPVIYYNDLMPMMIHAKTVTIQREDQIQEINLPINFVEKLIDMDGRLLFALPLPPVVGMINEGSPAAESDLKVGDLIVKIDDFDQPFTRDMQEIVQSKANQSVSLQVVRNNETLTLTSKVSEEGTIGILFQMPDQDLLKKLNLYEFENIKFGFFESFPAGAKMSYERVKAYAQQFKLIFNPQTGAYKGLGGFISIGKVFPDTWDWQSFLSITAFLSIVLAFMNFLPIPGLDGGHVIFTLIEMIIGRPVNEKVMEVATTIGLIFLLGLMLWANGMDFFRIFKG